MSSKKVTIGIRPTRQGSSGSADQWVESREASRVAEPMKRLTIDIPAELHRKIKGQCATRGTKMADEVRELLRQQYDHA